jgi:hypothetical protein
MDLLAASTIHLGAWIIGGTLSTSERFDKEGSLTIAYNSPEIAKPLNWRTSMNKLTRISQEGPAPTVLEHDQPSRTGKGVPLVNHPKWVTVSELVRAWAKELADARTGVYEFEDKLSYQLEKDIINGLLDDPLRNGSRLGVRVIGPGGQPMYIEGWQLNGLFRTMERYILLSEQAVLEFARLHTVRPPSWCDASKGEIQPSRSPEELKPAAGTAWYDRPRDVSEPSRSPEELKPAPDPIVIEAIRGAYDAAEKAGTKPPNIKELPAAVQPLLQQKGFSTSGRHIMRLGDAEEFERRRRRPGKTVASERRKK